MRVPIQNIIINLSHSQEQVLKLELKHIKISIFLEIT